MFSILDTNEQFILAHKYVSGKLLKESFFHELFIIN